MRLAWLTDVRPEGLRAGTVETHGDRVCIANMYKRRAQPVSSPDYLKRDGDAATFVEFRISARRVDHHILACLRESRCISFGRVDRAPADAPGEVCLSDTCLPAPAAS